METAAKRNVTVYYGLIMAVYSMGFCTMSAFSSFYLLDAGMSNSNVGYLIAISSLLAVLLQPGVGMLIDRNPRISTSKCLVVMASLVVATAAGIIFVPNKSVTVTALMYGTCIMLLMLAQPFFNALGMDAVNYGYPLNIGISRSLGSMGYAVCSFAFGLVSTALGPKSVPFAFGLAFFVLTVMVCVYPVKKPITAGSSAAGEGKSSNKNPLAFLVKYKRFTLMLVGLVLVYLSHAFLNTFALQVVMPKGGNSSDMGTASAIAAGCELITTAIFMWYMKKIKLSNIIKISAVFFTLKVFLSFAVKSMLGFYIVQTLQMYGWGFMSVGVVIYVNELVGKEDKAQGQAYAGMAYTIASVLASFGGGRLIDIIGVDNTLISGTVLSVIGTIIIYFTA